jgi:hypothetical protein
MDEIPVHDSNNFNNVLLIIGWQHCPYSHRAYESLPELKDKLLQFDPGLRIVVHITERLASLNTVLIPKCLGAFLKWSPYIMYIPGDLWNRAIEDSSFIIQGGIYVMNGERLDEDQIIPRNYRFKNTPDDIIEWLELCKGDLLLSVKCPEE